MQLPITAAVAIGAMAASAAHGVIAVTVLLPHDVELVNRVITVHILGQHSVLEASYMDGLSRENSRTELPPLNNRPDLHPSLPRPNKIRLY
jgi:hypothetical protein